MCGIAGLFFGDSAGISSLPEDCVARMLAQMAYRGPDHQGVFACPTGAIGNVRLAIQGLDPRGNQPIFNEDRSVAVVFNGEIYNYPELRQLVLATGHKLNSDTDTEVLVHLYEEFGLGFPAKLNGMFAFAIFDSRDQSLILGRDAVGQKPFFVQESRHGLAFCSELAPLIREFGTIGIEPAAVNEFLSLGYVLEPRTICRDVRTLMPGTVERHIGDGSHTTTRYWTNLPAGPAINDMDAWLEEAESVFRRAMRRHVLADVPVTLFLSGGVDSSLMLTLAAEETGIREAFCGSFLDAADHDEYRFAESLAAGCGLRCRRIDLSERMLADCLPEFLSRLSQPIGDYSALAVYPLAREVSRSYRVVLGGDGGDELFGGYPTYRLPGLQRKFQYVPHAAIAFGHRCAALLGRKNSYMSLAFQLQQVSQAWGRPTGEAHFEIKNFLPVDVVDALVPELREARGAAVQRFGEIYQQQQTGDVPVRLANVDIETFMLSGTIPKVDRMTMLHSLEARLPFLDTEVLELSQRTPSGLRMLDGKLKAPLRELFRTLWKKSGRPQPPLLNPRKQGFSPPLRKMLDGPLKVWRDDVLHTRGTLFAKNADEVINRLQHRGFDTHRLEWSICILQEWLGRVGIPK